jgi:NADPH-dependent F420 reductase
MEIPNVARIAILGTGKIARGLGRAWARKGHPVTFGSRSHARGRAFADEIGFGTLGADAASAVDGAQVVLLAVPWADAAMVVRSINFDAKVVIDPTNPMDERFVPLTDAETSLAEMIAGAAPSARVVKAFNTTFAQIYDLEETLLREAETNTYLASDDEEAKTLVGSLAAEIGFSPIDAGPLAVSRLLEAAAAFIATLAYKRDFGQFISLNVHEFAAVGVPERAA